LKYKEALDYILGFADYERLSRSAVIFDLARMEIILKRMGNPHEAAKSVHIAGTKGKGSTAAMIASVLYHAGYRTGLYTSPHLFNMNERIQIDGKPIPEDIFGSLTEIMKPEVEAVNRYGGVGELTTYELLTTLAFLYFREAGADYHVLETGLGGRLDTSNVVQPAVCGITSISYDHMEVLGDTLAKIAAEKAGIIKTGSKVVCSPQYPEAMEVIESVCRERGAELIRVGSDVTWQMKSANHERQEFTLHGIRASYELTIPLLGEHQLNNAATAVAMAEVLAGQGADISAKAIADGMAEVYWPGRLQVLQREPWVVVDGAHNDDSIKILKKALDRHFDFERLFVIFGVSSDKNIPGIVAELAAYGGKIIITRARNPRALEASPIVNEFSKWGIVPEVADDVESALALAFSLASPKDLICATGSLFIVGEVMKNLQKSV